MRNFLFISGGNMIRQFTTFLAHISIARSLGSSLFGELTYAFSIYFILAGLGDFGSRFYSWKAVITKNISERQKTAVQFLIYRTIITVTFLIPINLGIWLTTRSITSTLLHYYTLAIVFNQVAYDWYFLSLNKMASLFIFNSFSGLFFLGTIYLFIHAAQDVVLIPILLALSYAIPAFILISKEGLIIGAEILRTENILKTVKKAFKLPLYSYKYLFYDLLQRVYTFFIFVIAGFYFDNKILGEFRIAHLIYSFVTSMAIFLGTSYFNKISEEVRIRGNTELVAEGVSFIFLLILPISLAGQDVIPQLIEYLLGWEYENVLKVLSILLFGLLFPALSNFVREVVVSTRYSQIAIWSYGTTILTTSVMLTIYHPQKLTYLGFILLIGELAGLFILFKFLPLQLLPKRSFTIGAISLGFTLLLKSVFYIIYFILSFSEYEVSLYSLIFNLLITGCLYTAYIISLGRMFNFLSSKKGKDVRSQ